MLFKIILYSIEKITNFLFIIPTNLKLIFLVNYFQTVIFFNYFKVFSDNYLLTKCNNISTNMIQTLTVDCLFICFYLEVIKCPIHQKQSTSYWFSLLFTVRSTKLFISFFFWASRAKKISVFDKSYRPNPMFWFYEVFVFVAVVSVFLLVFSMLGYLSLMSCFFLYLSIVW